MRLPFSAANAMTDVIRRALLLGWLLTGCSGGRRSPDPSASPVSRAPLASFAAERMIALPVQQLLGGDAGGWTRQVGDPKRFLAAVDSALEQVLRGRGLGSTWSFPSDLARTARRNPTFAANPADIRAADAVRLMEKKSDSQIPEPVASQLRALAGFHDARHALIPVDVRFVAEPAGGGQYAVLHLAVLDVRGSRLVWDGDVAGDGAADYSPAIVTSLAERFADLLVARH